MLKNLCIQRGYPLSNKNILLITLLSGMANTSATHPFWLIQTRICADKENKSFLRHVKALKDNEGWTSFYKGLLPNLILVINPIINFMIYENLKARFMPNGGASFLRIFGFSMASKLVATLVTYPILTIKTKANVNIENLPVWKIVERTIKKDGFLSLYRGLTAKIV